ITTGDIKISVLVDKADGVRALRAVHQAFGLHQPRPGAGSSPGQGSSGVFRRRPQALVENADSPLTTHHSPLTNIAQHLSSMEDIVVSDVLLTTDQGRITIFNLPDQAGICSRVFQAVAAAGIIVDMIVHNLTSTGLAELSFSVPLGDLPKALKITEKLLHEIDPQTR